MRRASGAWFRSEKKKSSEELVNASKGSNGVKPDPSLPRREFFLCPFPLIANNMHKESDSALERKDADIMIHTTATTLAIVATKKKAKGLIVILPGGCSLVF